MDRSRSEERASHLMESLNETNENKIEPTSRSHQFFQDVLQSLTEPTQFFTKRYPRMNLTDTLVFAVVVSWIASLMEWLVRVLKNETILGGLTALSHQLDSLPIFKTILSPGMMGDFSAVSNYPVWLFEFSAVAVSPFKALLEVTMGGVFVWLAALILIPKSENNDPVDLTSFIRLMAISSTAPKLVGATLGFLPLGLGTFIGAICVFLLQVFALRTRYHVSSLRGTVILMLPGLVVMTMMLALIAAVVLFLMLVFGGH